MGNTGSLSDRRERVGAEDQRAAQKLKEPGGGQRLTSDDVCGFLRAAKESDQLDLVSSRRRQNRVLILLRGGCSLSEWRMRRDGRTEVFKMIDSDCSGTLTRQELTQALATGEIRERLRQQKGPLRALLNPRLVEQAWNLIDVNNDDEVDLDEWHTFIYMCSYRKLRFLEAQSHLLIASYWGYGCEDSLYPTPHAFWDEGLDREKPSREGRYRLCFFVDVPRGWGHDLWYYTCQNHSLLSQFYVDEDHPIDKWERFVTEMTLWGYTLMMTAARDFIQALRVVNTFPGACSNATETAWDCLFHNCLCRPGHLEHCQELLCDLQNSSHIYAECYEYGMRDPGSDVCIEQRGFLDWVLWPPTYVAIVITIPSLFLQTVLWYLLASPCTLVDETHESYTHSVCRLVCHRMQHLSTTLFFLLALSAWVVGIFLSFTQLIMTALGHPEHSDWVHDHWLQLGLFCWGRCQTYLTQFLMFVMFAFNPFAVHRGPDGEESLKWWADPSNCIGGFLSYWLYAGNWHRERLEFERLSQEGEVQDAVSEGSLHGAVMQVTDSAAAGLERRSSSLIAAEAEDTLGPPAPGYGTIPQSVP